MQATVRSIRSQATVRSIKPLKAVRLPVSVPAVANKKGQAGSMCVRVSLRWQNTWKRAHDYMVCRLLPRSSHEAKRVQETRDGGHYLADIRLSTVEAVLIEANFGGEN